MPIVYIVMSENEPSGADSSMIHRQQALNKCICLITIVYGNYLSTINALSYRSVDVFGQ